MTKGLRRVEEEKTARMAKPQEAQQEWRRSLVVELKKKTEKHCSKGMPEKACLLELGWYTKEVIVMYIQCERCGEKECHVEENKRQGVIKDRQRWCRYKGKAAWPRETKV